MRVRLGIFYFSAVGGAHSASCTEYTKLQIMVWRVRPIVAPEPSRLCSTIVPIRHGSPFPVHVIGVKTRSFQMGAVWEPSYAIVRDPNSERLLTYLHIYNESMRFMYTIGSHK